MFGYPARRKDLARIARRATFPGSFTRSRAALEYTPIVSAFYKAFFKPIARRKNKTMIKDTAKEKPGYFTGFFITILF
jgi:hypothetical protein